jgi:predicted HTH transcriptional regulator
VPLGYKRVLELTPQDVQGLVGTLEDIELDFKRDPYANPSDCCVDIASMANAEGGYIVVGMNEVNRAATTINALSHADALRESERMRFWCHDWIRPRVPDLEIEPVEVESGRDLVVARVPKSPVGPHMVTFDRRTQFTRRYQDGNREMTYEEIRAEFLGDAALVGIEEIRAGMRDLRRSMAREREVRMPADPNELGEPRDVQDYMERRLRKRMEEKE